jgi:hypothetical protein
MERSANAHSPYIRASTGWFWSSLFSIKNSPLLVNLTVVSFSNDGLSLLVLSTLDTDNFSFLVYKLSFVVSEELVPSRVSLMSIRGPSISHIDGSVLVLDVLDGLGDFIIDPLV